MKTLKLLPFTVIFFLMTACHFTSSSTNLESDRDEADLVIEELYDYLEKEEYDNAEKLFSEKFFEVTDRDKLRRIFETTRKKGGKVISNEIVDWKTFVVKGTKPKAEYRLIYKVKRDSATTNEDFGLVKEGDKIKIIGYYVTFDLMDELELDSTTVKNPELLN